MDDALIAMHTPELQQMERVVCDMDARTDRSLAKMEPVSTAQTTREPKETL